MNIDSSSVIELGQMDQSESNTNPQQQGIQVNKKVVDKLTLSPLDKYKIYGNFPCKLVTHIFLTIFTTFQILSYTSMNHLNLNAQRVQWYTMFMGGVGDNVIHPLYTIGQFQEQVNGMLENIDNFDGQSFQTVETIQNTVAYIECQYNFPFQYSDEFVNGKQNKYIYEFDVKKEKEKGIKEPFDIDDVQSIKQFLKLSKSFTIQFQNLKLKQPNQVTCWDVQVKYDLIQSSMMYATLYSSLQECIGDDVQHDLFNSYQIYGISYLISGFVLIFAFTCLILNFRYVFSVAEVYMKIRHQNQKPVFNPQRKIKEKYLTKTEKQKDIYDILESQKSWNQLSLSEKMVFVDTWFLFTLIGNIFQILSTLGFLVSSLKNEPQSTNLQWALGLACLFAWGNMVKYVRFHSKINIIMNVIGNAFPRILTEAVGFIPILMMFIVVGIAFFSASNRFINFNMALTTLFSLLLGDSVNDITQDLRANSAYGFVGIIYTVSFCFCFMLAVHNIWIAIIMEELQKKKQKEDMKKLKKQEQLMNTELQQKLYQSPNSPIKEQMESLFSSPEKYKSINATPQKIVKQTLSSESIQFMATPKKSQSKELKYTMLIEEDQDQLSKDDNQSERDQIIENQEEDDINTSTLSGRLLQKQQTPLSPMKSPAISKSPSKEYGMAQQFGLSGYQMAQSNYMETSQIHERVADKLQKEKKIRLQETMENFKISEEQAELIDDYQEKILMVNKEIKFLLKDNLKELNNSKTNFNLDKQQKQEIAQYYNEQMYLMQRMMNKFGKKISNRMNQLEKLEKKQ